MIDLAADPGTGRRRQMSKGGFATKRAAEEAMRDAIARGTGGTGARVRDPGPPGHPKRPPQLQDGEATAAASGAPLPGEGVGGRAADAEDLACRPSGDKSTAASWQSHTNCKVGPCRNRS